MTCTPRSTHGQSLPPHAPTDGSHAQVEILILKSGRFQAQINFVTTLSCASQCNARASVLAKPKHTQSGTPVTPSPVRARCSTCARWSCSRARRRRGADCQHRSSAGCAHTPICTRQCSQVFATVFVNFFLASLASTSRQSRRFRIVDSVPPTNLSGSACARRATTARHTDCSVHAGDQDVLRMSRHTSPVLEYMNTREHTLQHGA